MADLPNGLLSPDVGSILSPGGQQVANINLGGQYGHAPHFDLFDATSPQVYRPVVPIVGHVPTILQKIPGAAAAIKTIMETCVQTLSGIDFGYTIETSDYIGSNDGQNRSAPLSGRRSEVAPSIVLPEVIGNVYWNVFRTWQRCIVDCDTQASALAGIIQNDSLPPHLVSAYSMDLVLIQYDMTLAVDNIIDAVILTQMFPNDIGQYGLNKEVGTAQRPDRNIAFKAVLQHNGNTLQIGKQIGKVLQLHKVDPYKAKPVVSDINSILNNGGLLNEVNMINSEWTAIAA